MTPGQLLEECDRAEAFTKEHGLSYEPAISVIVPRACNGERARIAPGLMGRVLGPSSDGKGTVVMVETAKVRKFLRSRNLD